MAQESEKEEYKSLFEEDMLREELGEEFGDELSEDLSDLFK